MTQFQISTRNSGRLRTVQVCIYDTVEQMRQAGLNHNKRIGGKDMTGFDKAYGLCQSLEKVSVYASGATRRLPEAGFIRLWKGALRTGIITHECAHMALAIYREDIGKTMPEPGTEKNEDFCYLLGDLSARLINKLYSHNLIPEPGK